MISRTMGSRMAATACETITLHRRGSRPGHRYQRTSSLAVSATDAMKRDACREPRLEHGRCDEEDADDEEHGLVPGQCQGIRGQEGARKGRRVRDRPDSSP